MEENQSLSEKKLDECFKNIKRYKDDLSNLQVKLSSLISESNQLELQNTKVESKLLSSEALIKELKNTERMSLEELSELEKEFNNSLNLPSLLAEELKVRNNADQSRMN